MRQPKRSLTAAQAAKKLSLTAIEFHQLTAKGILPYQRTASGNKMFNKRDLEKYQQRANARASLLIFW